jgi:hypothetical protein
MTMTTWSLIFLALTGARILPATNQPPDELDVFVQERQAKTDGKAGLPTACKELDSSVSRRCAVGGRWRSSLRLVPRIASG